MKIYNKIITTAILLLGVLCLIMAYQKFQLPYNEKGIFTTPQGDIIKRASAIKMLVLGILSFLFVLVWRVFLKKISKK